MEYQVDVRMRDIKIEQVGNEWCAFLDDREIARSPERGLLLEYLRDCVVSVR